MRQRLPYALLAACIVVLDQISKYLVDHFMEVHETRPVIDGLLHLTYVRNRGGAFGFLSHADLPGQAWIFTAVSVVALAAIAVYSSRIPAAQRVPQTGLALIMGGAVGNLLNRAAHGYVIDFVDAFWGPHHWPAFNLADSCISIGVGLLVLDSFRASEPAAAGAASSSTTQAPAGRSD